jgi:2-C-methyl-D-erythritol 2,4-cyclodiphosphate synthase
VSELRIGFAFDVHPLDAAAEPGSPRCLVLGGVSFEREVPLRGHSDADVLAHAVGEAMLGAAGLGDLGMHFPDDDELWLGADSLALLAACAGLVGAQGWALTNADCTIVAERPRVAPARQAMMDRLSRAARGPVHVKATRPEGLGSLGRGEGIACYAVALLERAQDGPAAAGERGLGAALRLGPDGAEQSGRSEQA